jgi:hypothetical protein
MENQAAIRAATMATSATTNVLQITLRLATLCLQFPVAAATARGIAGGQRKIIANVDHFVGLKTCGAAEPRTFPYPKRSNSCASATIAAYRLS